MKTSANGQNLISVAKTTNVTPEFLRFPRVGEIEPYSGLRRSQLYVLANDGLIKTVSLRRRGKIRGTRLIIADSLRGYLHGLVAEQCQTPATSAPPPGAVATETTASGATP